MYNVGEGEARLDEHTIVGHSKNGNLGDGSVTSLHTTGSFVHCSQVSIHVTRITTTTGNFFSSSRHLTQSITVRGQVRHDDQNVLLQLVRVVLGSRQCQTGSDNPFDSVDIN